MAKGKHISEDEIKYIVDVESAKAQQEIRKLEKSTDNLRSKSFKRFTICTIYSSSEHPQLPYMLSQQV